MLKFLPFLLIFIAAVYFGVRLATKRRGLGGGKGKSNGPRRPLGPDDDPDFLRGL